MLFLTYCSTASPSRKIPRRCCLALSGVILQAMGYVAATTITTLYYLCAKAGGNTEARRQVASLLALLDIAPVNRSVIESVLASRMRDFEDAVLAAAGTLVSVQAIATRNKHDFRLASISAHTPAELLELLDARPTNPHANPQLRQVVI